MCVERYNVPCTDEEDKQAYMLLYRRDDVWGHLSMAYVP